jgi:hypothetical protein
LVLLFVSLTSNYQGELYILPRFHPWNIKTKPKKYLSLGLKSILDPSPSLGSFSLRHKHSRRNPSSSLDFFIIHNQVWTWLGVQVGAPSQAQIRCFFSKKKVQEGRRLTCWRSSSGLASQILELFVPSPSSCKHKCKIKILSSYSHLICTSKNPKSFTKP